MLNRQLDSETQGILSVAVFRILKSLAKFAMNYGMSIGGMSELLRRAYLEAAEEVLEENCQRVTTVRICAMTGLYRKEIRRIEQLPALSDTSTDDKYNRCGRVINGWRHDPDFQTKTGKPAALKIEGQKGFDQLVRRYSGDVTPSAMKHELQRRGLIQVTSKKLVKLELNAYVRPGESEVIQILGVDTADLITTISQNINNNGVDSLFQRKLCYVNIPDQHIDNFFEFAETESQSVLEKLNFWLAERDNDYEEPDPRGARIGVGIYHFRQEHSGKKKASLKRWSEQ